MYYTLTKGISVIKGNIVTIPNVRNVRMTQWWILGMLGMKDPKRTSLRVQRSLGNWP